MDYLQKNKYRDSQLGENPAKTKRKNLIKTSKVTLLPIEMLISNNNRPQPVR